MLWSFHVVVLEEHSEQITSGEQQLRFPLSFAVTTRDLFAVLQHNNMDMEAPDKALGRGRSSSGVLTKRGEFPRLAHTRGRAVATCQRRHKKTNPPFNSPCFHLCTSLWAAGLHHALGGFMGPSWGHCGSYGLL